MRTSGLISLSWTQKSFSQLVLRCECHFLCVEGQSWDFLMFIRGLLDKHWLSMHLVGQSTGCFERALLLLLSCFSRVRLCATPKTAAHQAPPSLGFSRQEHWSGLPFPSPVHESEKSKWGHSVVSDSSRPHGLQPTRLLHPWDFPGKSTRVGCHCLLCERALGMYKKRKCLYSVIFK